MIRITIGLLLLLSFIQAVFLNNQVTWSGYMLIGAAIPMVIGLILFAFGLRKKWPEIKVGLSGWGEEGLLKIIKVYFTNFDKFLDKYISKSIPLFTLICISFIGIFMIIANPLNPYFGTWLYWPIAVILSPLFGIVIYLLGGFAYQLLASICGAKWNPTLSRKIFVYALAPSYMIGVISSLFYYFVYETRSLDVNTNKYVLLSWLIIVFAVSLYVFLHSNTAAKKVLGAKPIRSFIIFLLLPIILNIVTLGSTAMNAFGYVDSDTAYKISVEDKLTGIDLAQSKLDIGDSDSAKMIYEEIIGNEVNTGFTDDVARAYLGTAAIQMSQGDIKGGLKIINATLKKTEEGAEVDYMLKGLIAAINEDIEGAFKIFNEVIEINPDNFDANSWLGLYYIGINIDYKKALIYNKKAHELKATIDGLEMLAINYYLLESYNEAKIHFEELNRVEPNNTTALLKLGEIAYGFGDLDGAIKYFSELKKVDPTLITPQIEDILKGK